MRSAPTAASFATAAVTIPAMVAASFRPEELAREVKALFDTKTNEVKGIAEKALAEAERGIPMSETAKQLADQAISGMNEAKARLDDLEQKMARARRRRPGRA
jgi:hypothetical protein